MNNIIQTNVLPSPFDARDRISALISVPTPVEVDLKPFVYEVEDQRSFGSCTANAGCSALELLYKKIGKPVDLSRLYLYFYTRQLGGITTDIGAYPRDIGKALLTYGVPQEKLWDYSQNNLNLHPTPEIDLQASKFKIVSYEQIVGNKLSQIKNALAQDIPVLLTIFIHDSFSRLSGPWKTHSWDYTTTLANPIRGGHEILIIGYDDVSQRLLVENSWGSTWGDGGFFGIPYAMCESESFGELWTLTPNYDIDFEHDILPPTPIIPVIVEDKSNVVRNVAIVFVIFLAIMVINSIQHV